MGRSGVEEPGVLGKQKAKVLAPERARERERGEEREREEGIRQGLEKRGVKAWL